VPAERTTTYGRVDRSDETLPFRRIDPVSTGL